MNFLKILLNGSKIPEVLIKSTECIDEIIKKHPQNKDYLSVKAKLSEKKHIILMKHMEFIKNYQNYLNIE